MSGATLPPGAAVFLILFASSLWGTWPIALKHLHGFPLDGFILTLFLSSWIFVWIVALIDTQGGVVAELEGVAHTHWSLLASTLAGGVMYQVGMRVWLFVIHTRGLIFTTSINSSVSLILGTLSSSIAGGLPQGASVPLLAVGIAVLLLAIFTVTTATALRESAFGRLDRAPAHQEHAGPGKRPTVGVALGLCVISGLCTSAYPTAVALGLRSPLRPDGLSVLAFMAVLSTGAMLGALAGSGSLLTVRRQWGCLRRARRRSFGYGILAGLAHYGGNIINAFAVPVISPAIAWPMGTTSSLWGLAWGYVYREYKGAPRQIYLLQISGSIMFVLGIVILAIAH